MQKNTQLFNRSLRIGVLGGGQLGKMLALAANNWHLPLSILDRSKDFPAGMVSHRFIEGDFKSYDDVYRFGQEVDLLTIEIEHVNTDALLQLKKEGKIIHPDPEILTVIKDKGLQNQFYQDHGLPTAAFTLYEDEKAVKKAIQEGKQAFPFVQKTRTAGYDGRGVAVIQSEEEMHKLLPGACVLEDLVPIEKELAVIVARNENGEIVAYPPVEMVFNPIANLVEFLACPAQIEADIHQEAIALSKKVIETYDLCGLLAVELFLNKDGQVLINEVAPRPHNSGHHTIDSCYTSQFEQHLRAILNLPLGSTHLSSPAVMVNILGAPGHKGPTIYEGIDQCLAIEGVQIHLYGKTLTSPFRKMGHATVLAETLEAAIEKAKQVKEIIKVISTADS